MAFISDMQTALDALSGAVGDDTEAAAIPALMRQLGDDALITVIEQATALVRAGEAVRIAATGVIASRSTRAVGHGGLAQRRGHRSTVSLIQDLTGTTRADAAKQVRLGTALAESLGDRAGDDEPLAGIVTNAAGADAEGTDAGGTDAGGFDAAPGSVPARPWHATLGGALMAGTITSAQHDAIYRGLGEPPLPAPGTFIEVSPVVSDDGAAGADAAEGAVDPAQVAAEITAAWETAATQLIDEAPVRTVEELASAARTIRDLLDSAGAQQRFDARYQARSFRTWTDRDGTRHGSFVFDDEGGAWIDTVINTALRPRRGGPRFVDPAEKQRAEELVDDPRTNDQLAYDLILDILRAGALADVETVFGTRQAGVRIVTTAASYTDTTAGRPAVALLEEADVTLPGWLVARQTCDIGTVPVIHDLDGNPLDLGREARLYTPKQRVALAIRDGGCRIPGCDRPASYTEAHHIDEWHADHGRTDIDRGILLCTFHHLNMHHHGWRITRHGKGDFFLHRPGTSPVLLPERLPRRFAFTDLKPPPRRFRPAA